MKLFLPLIMLVCLATEATASCPSMSQGPPCLEYWRAEAVFIAMVNRVVPTPNETGLVIGPYVKTTVYLSVEESFKGIGETSLVLNLDHCGHRFKENERYLVYAHRNPNNNQLDVRLGNTRTRLLSEAGEDLEYIRGLTPAQSGGRIFGKVVHYDHKLKEQRMDVALLQDIRITLEGNNERREVVSDSEGRYEFNGLPQGTYRIRAEMPDRLGYEEQTIKLSGRECVPLDLHAKRLGQIAGRVLDLNGKPLARVPMSLAPADATLEQIVSERGWISTSTNRDGVYRFTQLAPGRYLVIINRTESEKAQGSEVSRAFPRLFYPGASDLGGAVVIVVGQKSEPREYDFRLPVQ